MSLANVRENLKTRLETIQGLSVYKQPPDALPQLPVAIVTVAAAAYNQTAGGLVTWSLRILLLLAEQESEKAWTELDNWLEISGDKSIKAAVEGGTVADYAWVSSLEHAGHIAYRGHTFIGAEFICEVGDSS
jgi:hypothetical protein